MKGKDAGGKSKVKTREGSGYLRQLYSTARVTANSTHSHLKNLTTILVNFVPIEKVDASELQVRTHFDDQEIQALSVSIKKHGVLQPILVVQDGDRYKVIAGERRLRASKLAGMDRIPARVITTDDKATHEIALRENLDRVDLHPIEEGEGYLSLLEAGAFTSHEGISKAFGKPKSRITECIGFTRLPDDTKQELLRLNVKNRSLLRQMMNTPPEDQMTLVAKASKMDEEQLIAQVKKAKTKGESKKPKKKAESFTYKCDEKGLQIPGFKWKPGEGAVKLREYKEALSKLILDIEVKHLKK